MYNFKRATIGQAVQFRNPEFSREKYDRLINVRKTAKRGEEDEISQLQATFIMLESNFNARLKAATDLRNQISETRCQNFEMVNSIAKFQLFFVERVKALVLNMAVCVQNFKINELEKLLAILKQNHMISVYTKDTPEEFYNSIDLRPEILMRFAATQLVDPTADNQYRFQTLKLSLGLLNRCFFQLPFDQFFVSALRHVLRGEPAPELETHRNYEKLESAMDLYREILSKSMGGYLTPGLEFVMRSLYDKHEMELVEMANGEVVSAVDTRDSVRSLQNQLRLNDTELLSLLMFNFDE